MRGIIHSYLVHSKIMILAKIAYIIFLVWWIPFSDGQSFVLASIAIGGGSVLLMNTSTFGVGYLRIMPVKSWKVVFVPYLYSIVAFVMGLVFAFARILFFGDHGITDINLVLFATGLFMTIYSVSQIYTYVKSMFIILLALTAPVLQLVIIFGIPEIYEVVRNWIDGTYLMQSDIFYQTTRWLIFLAISIMLYIASYFVAIVVYKKSDTDLNIQNLLTRI